MKLRFWKLSGAGNDFVLIDRLPKGKSAAWLARHLCDRREGIGADGLLVMSRRNGRPRLDYFNADGSVAFCGNGTRCAALWAVANRWATGPGFTLDTNRGPLRVRLTGAGRAEVQMPEPKGLVLSRKLRAGGRSLSVHFVDTGVPHAVVFVPDIDAVKIAELGPALRRHAAFGKAGANVNFIVAARGAVRLRTYERGVEDETLACGTGVMAAAFVARALGRASEPVRVQARGGTLRASFTGGARLEGPGRVVYQGEIAL